MSLDLVVGWLLEHALRHHMMLLRNEIKKHFPHLVHKSSDEFQFPNKDIVTDLTTARLISKNEFDLLGNLMLLI